MSVFGDTFKQLRLKKGITQDDIAAELQISRASISRYENGEREPSFENLQTIARYFSVPLDFLFGLTSMAASYQSEAAASIEPDIDIVGEGGTDYGIDNDLKEFIRDENFIRLVRKIKDNSISIETIENLIDNILAINKTKKAP